jgi:hypothetical protein
MLNIAKHIIFSLFSFLMLYSCANVNQEKKFLSNLENVIQQQTEDAVIINIDSLTEFDWDVLYIFKPYTSNRKINKELGEEWLDSEGLSLLSSESYTLFVFKKNNKIVNDFFVPSKISKEFGFLNAIKYSKDKAKFISVNGEYTIRNFN